MKVLLLVLLVSALPVRADRVRVHDHRHSRRGPATHQRGHGVQHSAHQHRRHHRAAARARGAARAQCHRVLPRRGTAARGTGVLVVVVQERPSIRTFEVTGNKALKTEDLTKSLRNVGLASGKILNRSTLEDTRQYLIEQYFARGQYDVRVDATVAEQPNNLVDVHVKIVEGERVRIRRSTWWATSASATRNCSPASSSRRRTSCRSIAATTSIRARPRGRPGKAALLLHGPRLCRLRDHLDAGDARAREG